MLSFLTRYQFFFFSHILERTLEFFGFNCFLLPRLLALLQCGSLVLSDSKVSMFSMCALSYSLSATCSRWHCHWNDSVLDGTSGTIFEKVGPQPTRHCLQLSRCHCPCRIDVGSAVGCQCGKCARIAMMVDTGIPSHV